MSLVAFAGSSVIRTSTLLPSALMESAWNLTGISAAFAIACNVPSVILPAFLMFTVAVEAPDAFAAAAALAEALVAVPLFTSERALFCAV